MGRQANPPAPQSRTALGTIHCPMKWCSMARGVSWCVRSGPLARVCFKASCAGAVSQHAVCTLTSWLNHALATIQRLNSVWGADEIAISGPAMHPGEPERVNETKTVPFQPAAPEATGKWSGANDSTAWRSGEIRSFSAHPVAGPCSTYCTCALCPVPRYGA